MMEVDRDEFLELKMGYVLGTMISIMEEENVDSGTLLIHMLKEPGKGFEFQINAEKIPKNKRLLRRIKEWMTSDNNMI